MSSTLLLLIVLLLGGLLAYSGNALMQMQRERDRLRQELRRYDSLTSREETERQLDSNISLKRSDLAELERQRGFLNNQINNLQQELRELEAKAYLQSIDYLRTTI
jgi:uncharacterized protein HemX